MFETTNQMMVMIHDGYHYPIMVIMVMPWTMPSPSNSGNDYCHMLQHPPLYSCSALQPFLFSNMDSIRKPICEGHLHMNILLVPVLGSPRRLNRLSTTDLWEGVETATSQCWCWRLSTDYLWQDRGTTWNWTAVLFPQLAAKYDLRTWNSTCQYEWQSKNTCNRRRLPMLHQWIVVWNWINNIISNRKKHRCSEIPLKCWSINLFGDYELVALSAGLAVTETSKNAQSLMDTWFCTMFNKSQRWVKHSEAILHDITLHVFGLFMWFI